MTATGRPFSVIDGHTIARLLRDEAEDCIRTVEAAYLAHAGGRSINPNSLFLTFPERPRDRIIALPAHLEAPWNVSGIKWIASYPDNVRHGFPRASAVLILNDAETGYPFACLESSVISASRTAASAVLAAHHLCSRAHRVRSMGIVGTGLIARYVYRFMLAVGWQIEDMNLYDVDVGAAERFRDDVCLASRHRTIQLAEDTSGLVRCADLILFTTTMGTPHVHDRRLFAHRPVILHVSLRDLAPSILLDAWNVVDDVDHVLRAGTSAHLAEQLSGSRAFVTGTLADVLTGACAIDHSRSVVFSPFGLGVLDLAVGKWVYDRAISAGRHHVIERFFDTAEP